MIKMILADDEPVIIRGLQKLVDFNRLGIEIVGEYEDGKAAFDGILTEKPDIALLDIYMPKKTGIEILKELKALGIETKVIFVSGFQDFQYAKDALTYGAVNYLLKPVIREELVETLEKCITMLKNDADGEGGVTEHPDYPEEEGTAAAYDKLVEMEECRYLPILTEILYSRQTGKQERRLVRFSVLSFLEQYLEKRHLGIVFLKNGHIVMVLKNPEKEETGRTLGSILEEAEVQLHIPRCRLGFIVGNPVDSMGEIPKAYEACLSMTGYLYFSSQIKIPVLHVGEPVFKKPATLEEIREVRNQLIEGMVAQDEKAFTDAAARFRRLVCLISEGRRDDACFHYGSTIRIIEERFETMGIDGMPVEFKDILEQARQSESYECLTGLFEGYFKEYKDRIKKAVVSSEKKDIIHAREYIERHYSENLTLEVLAGEIHMNPYYFSSFFKKNSGENFKDYLNKVRMKHAVDLLVSTDKKTAEIADLVGFRDGRGFSELFSRIYGETPSSYRKRVKGS